MSHTDDPLFESTHDQKHLIEQPFTFDVRKGLFTSAEESRLRRIGTWLRALTIGSVIPNNEVQRHFVEVANFRAKPMSKDEHLWMRLVRELESKRNDVCLCVVPKPVGKTYDSGWKRKGSDLCMHCGRPYQFRRDYVDYDRWFDVRETRAYRNIEASEETFEEEVLVSFIPVLVLFYAQWCETSKASRETLEWLATRYAGLLRVRCIDVDNSHQCAAKYGVTSIPTLILFDTGKVDRVFTGVTQTEDIQTAVDYLLSIRGLG